MNRVFFTLMTLLLTAFVPALNAQVILKVATVAPEGSGWMREMRAGAEAVKTRTDGRVLVKYFPGGVQGNEVAVLRKIRLGQLQGGAFAGAELAAVVPDAQIYSLPFQFRSQAEVDFIRPKLDARMRAEFENKGLVVAGMAGGGFTYLMSSRPIHTRDDLRATKVWFPQGDTIARITFETGGVQPIPLPLADVYTALSTGMVETVGNTNAGAIAFQWHTRIKHVIDLPLTYVIGILVFDQRTLDKLPAADRAVLIHEIDQAFSRIDALNRKDNEAARGVLVRQGIRFEAPDDSVRGFWLSIGTDARRKMEQQNVYSATLSQEIDRLLQEFRSAGGQSAGR